MHLYVTEELIRQREQELHRPARRYIPPRQFRRCRDSVRHRAGWLLIEIGLALAQGSGDA
jgi:hypothetical protein